MAHKEIIDKIFSKGKGILAADESNKSANKRFTPLGITEDKENRRQWRELLITTPGSEKYISGIIFYDETARQSDNDGVSFLEILKNKGIVTGIKVDKGLVYFENSNEEQITNGLDELDNDLDAYVGMGMEFTKWRNVFYISDSTPTDRLIEKNTKTLAIYANKVVQKGMVPILEPEILIKGNRSIERTREIMGKIFDSLFEELKKENVPFGSIIIKTSFVIPGFDGPNTTSKEIGEYTIDLFEKHFPKDIGGIVFLSGGLSSESTFKYLEYVIKQAREKKYNVPITFSYSRALQLDALEKWRGDSKNKKDAQEIFKNKLKEATDSLC